MAIKTIGVLGGMGAAASADFYQRLVRGAQEIYHAEQDRDFPEMIIYNLCLSDFDETGITEEESVKKQLIAGVQKLENAGADFIVIPCNTVHVFIKEMQEAVQIPIISIIDTVVAAIERDQRKNVGLLSSRTTRDTHLYEGALNAAGIQFLSANPEEQDAIDDVIAHVISGTQGTPELGHSLQLIERISKLNADSVVLGCTELPLVLNQSHTSLPLYNSTQLLAEAALRTAYGK